MRFIIITICLIVPATADATCFKSSIYASNFAESVDGALKYLACLHDENVETINQHAELIDAQSQKIDELESKIEDLEYRLAEAEGKISDLEDR